MVYAFDLDDTLYTEMDFVRSGYREVSRVLAAGSYLDAETYYEGIFSHRPLGFEWALDQYKSHGGSDGNMSVAGMIEIYRAHKPDISLRPGVDEMLKRLKAAGHTLILITDGSTRHQRSKLRALGIEKLFDNILISEETGGDKTTLVPWMMVEEKYACPGQRFTYIGDNLKKDFKIPGERGWHTIMVLGAPGQNVFPQDISAAPAAYRPKCVIKYYKDIV